MQHECFIELAVGSSAPQFVGQCRCAFGLIAALQTSHLPHGHLQHGGRRGLRKRSLTHLFEHPQPARFLLAHRDHRPCLPKDVTHTIEPDISILHRPDILTLRQQAGASTCV